MNKVVTIAMAGIFVLSLQGPGRAQKEVAPPPISPLLEGQRPLDHPETSKEPAAPQKQEEKKAKPKSVKNQKTAKAKKLVNKKRQAVAKKKNQKASTKKRPAETQQQKGPDEG